MRWNILSFGRILFNVAARRARHQQALVQYQNTVLRAVEEVENGLVGVARERQRAETLAHAVQALRDAVRLSKSKYAIGLIQFQTVLDSERELLITEEALAISRGTIVLNIIRTYEALGGGWMAPPAMETIPAGPPAEELLPPASQPVDAAAEDAEPG